MYYVFAGDNYYPCGGAGDFQFKSEHLEACRAWVIEQARLYDWWEITDDSMAVLDSQSMRAQAMRAERDKV